jgi:hypothetical protein
MTSRVLTLLVLLYVAADLADPMVPGVFSFATDRLFLDGVVHVKTSTDMTAGGAGIPGPMTTLSRVVRPSGVKVASRAATSPQVASYQHRHRSHPPDAATDRDQVDGDPLA